MFAPSQARRYFGKATALDRGFAPAWVAFGHAFAAQDESDQAREDMAGGSRSLLECQRNSLLGWQGPGPPLLAACSADNCQLLASRLRGARAPRPPAVCTSSWLHACTQLLQTACRVRLPALPRPWRRIAPPTGCSRGCTAR